MASAETSTTAAQCQEPSSGRQLPADGARFDRLIDALHDPRRYSHPVQRVERLETHISWILLTGAYAYKIKKPVEMGFLDFRSLDARRFYCYEELRLNRRTAPQLYIDVVPITGSPASPLLDGKGQAIEYAVRMRQFSQDALLHNMARRGELRSEHIDAFAKELARFHMNIDRSDAGRPFGLPERILSLALENFEQIEALAGASSKGELLADLRGWTEREYALHRNAFDSRRREGFVRECHGDLHLGNIVLLDGVPTAFDCIEFNKEFRWIDVANEIAFPVMDLNWHRLPGLAHRFLSAYLESTADYDGLELIRFYAVHRAMVRAKVVRIRLGQAGLDSRKRRQAHRDYLDYLRLASILRARAQGALLVMHGLSGSGKSAVAERATELLGAVRLRSDVERKRLHGLAPEASTGSGLAAGIYAPLETERTYAGLAEMARRVIAAGYPVVVDAAFLTRRHRDALRELAGEMGIPFAIASCTAPESLLRERLARRASERDGPSEAGPSVLDLQLRTQEPLAEDERLCTVSIDTAGKVALPRGAAAALRRRLNLHAT